MARMERDPPRLCERLLESVVPGGVVGEDVVGSLAQEHAERVEREGARAADRWYRRQALGIVVRALPAAMVRSGRASAPSAALAEVRRAVRRLARAPSFSLSAIATLALGIGGSTAVFGIAYGALVRPLPYPSPDRLVDIRNENRDRDFSLSMVDWLALSGEQTSFDAIAAYDPNPMTLTTPDGAESVDGLLVTPELTALLGLEPVLGRGIRDEDTRPGAEPVALLGNGIWRTRFGGSPDVVGRTVTIDESRTTVVGVLPPVAGPIERGRDLVLPLVLEPPNRKGPFFLGVIGRLDPSVDPAVAQAELSAMSERLFPVWQDSFRDAEARWRMTDLRTAVLGDAARSLGVALSAVAALLLIALANATNLLVARAVEGGRETAVRAALGAGRLRLVAHRMGESAVLAGLGGAAGLGLASVALPLARSSGGAFLPRVEEATLDGPILLFVAGVTVAGALVMGLVPALQVGASSFSAPGSTRGASAGRGLRTVRRALVIGQLAVTVPLLLGSVLLGISLRSLRSADPGFDTERVLTVGLTLPPVGYADGSASAEFWTRLAGEVAALPGIDAVGVGTGRPPDDPAFGNNFVLEDQPLTEGAAQPSVPWTIADPGYFEALGVPLLAGTLFTTDADSTRVAVVDATWARRFFDGPEAAVGRRFVHGGCTDVTSCPWWTVVGVVDDVEWNGIANGDEGAMYLDARTYPQRGGFLMVRAETGDPAGFATAVRRIARAIDPSVPVTDVATGSELMAASLRGDRYLATLVGLFGAVAFVLSLIGVYGVLAYFVEHRRRDIGIRLALGDAPRNVAGGVVAAAMRLVGAGLAIGTVLALALQSTIEGVLYDVRPWDPVAISAVVTALAAAALLACWGPARRAASLDPAYTLKGD